MSVIPGQLLRKIDPPIVNPFVERGVQNGRSYGLSVAGYDIRVDLAVKRWEFYVMYPGDFMLMSSIEEFCMPNDVIGFVHDKSSWARQGIAVQNTVIEPGWKGFLTMEVTNHTDESVKFMHGDPIAQIVFHRLEEPAEKPYDGKYQNQERGPQAARYEE